VGCVLHSLIIKCFLRVTSIYLNVFLVLQGIHQFLRITFFFASMLQNFIVIPNFTLDNFYVMCVQLEGIYQSNWLRLNCCSWGMIIVNAGTYLEWNHLLCNMKNVTLLGSPWSCVAWCFLSTTYIFLNVFSWLIFSWQVFFML